MSTISRYDDPVRGVDFGHCVSRHGDIRADFADLSVFDQHVCLCEIADLRVERQYHAALEQDAAFPCTRLNSASEFPVSATWATALPDCNICATEPPAAMPTPDLRNLRRDVPPGDVGISSQTNEPGVAGVLGLQRSHMAGSSDFKDGALGRARSARVPPAQRRSREQNTNPTAECVRSNPRGPRTRPSRDRWNYQSMFRGRYRRVRAARIPSTARFLG